MMSILLTLSMVAVNAEPAQGNSPLQRLQGRLAELQAARRTGDFETMENVARAALREAEELFGVHEFTAEMATQLGLVLLERGNFAAAAPQFDRALELRDTPNLPFVSDGRTNEPWRQFHAIISLRNRGYLALRSRDLNRADQFLQTALTRLDKGDFTRRIAPPKLAFERSTLLLQLGQVDEELGRFDAANRHLTEAVQGARALESAGRQILAASRNAQGMLLVRRDQIEEAEAALREAETIRLDLLQTSGNLAQARRELAETRNNLGWLLLNRGDMEGARAKLEKAIEGMTKLRGPDHPSLAEYYANYAATFARDSGRADRQQTQQWLQKCLAVVQGDRPEGRRAHALTIAVARINLARWVHAPNEDWSAALEQLDEARQLLHTYARTVLSSRPEAEQLDFLVNKERNWFHTAVTIAVRAAKAGRSDPARVSAAWVLNAKGLSRELLAAQIRAKADPQFVLRGVREASWVTPAEVAPLLPRDAALVEMVRYQPLKFGTSKEWDWEEPCYAAWVIEPGDGRTRVIDLGRAQPIDTAVKAGRQRIQDVIHQTKMGQPVNFRQDEALLRQTLQPIHERVLGPLDVSAVRRWIISPDGELWLLPWAALPEGTGFVAERHAVRLVATGRELLTTSAATSTSPAVVFSDIDYDGRQPFGLLPQSNFEGQLVSRSLKDLTGQAARTISRSAATAEAFRAIKRPRVLYVSTHGVADIRQEAPNFAKELQLAQASDPLDTCLLAFAKANTSGRRGVMLGRQILGMDLQGTEAVVLSACSTGTGQLRGTNVSEGVASLSHAFRLAGARVVVGTLWEVEDHNTAEMMQGLFQELNKSPEQGRDWSLALQAAQIERIRALADPDSVGVAHPFFWAGVTLVGP